MTNGQGFFEDFDPERPRARRTDPWTSKAAADSIPSEKLRASQEAVLACFQMLGPMTHSRLLTLYDMGWKNMGWPQQSESGLRTRANELVSRGILRDSGEVIVLPSGRKSIVWELA